jgi:hypothetical protein
VHADRFVDLHLHSTCSDGIYLPAEVVRLAAAAGLAAIALCDHDNIECVDAAVAAGRELGVEVITGSNSVLWGSTRTFTCSATASTTTMPSSSVAARVPGFPRGRNERIVEQVNEKLADEGRRQSISPGAGTGRQDGRAAGCQALMRPGMSRTTTRPSATTSSLQRRQALLPRRRAIALVHRAGAHLLAHPPSSPATAAIQSLLDAFVPLGLEGVEAWNNGSGNNDIDWYITAARRRGLIVTGGSDFHGIEGGQVRIGGGRGNLKIPYSCVDEIRQALARRRA